MMEKNISGAMDKLTHGMYVLGVHTEEKENLMTAAWVAQVASRPPMVMVAIGTNHYTRELIEEAGEFTVSVLTIEQKKIAKICGFQSGRKTDKISQVAVDYLEGVPVVGNSAAYLKCRVNGMYPIADHTMVVGEVVDARLCGGEPAQYYRDEYFG